MFLSIITPTYNRAFILKDCYESLVRQTYKDFEWIVVDDGSTDNTEAFVQNLICEGLISIRYIRQENGGKHRAHNTGVLAALGDMCVCLDSDDQLTRDAVEVAYKIWTKKTNSNIGILAKRGSIKDGTPICSEWPMHLRECTMFSLINDYGFHGDTVLFFETKLLKANLFKEFDGEKFLSEANLYYDLDAYGKMILLNEVLYLCEYLGDGLTSKYHQLLKDNPLGTADTYYKSMKLSNNILLKCKYSILANIYLNIVSNKEQLLEVAMDPMIRILRLPSKIIGPYFLKKFER